MTLSRRHLVIAALNDSYRLFRPGELPLIGDVAALTMQTIAIAFKIGIGGAGGLGRHHQPTHYAVALTYERGMNAPVCVAKGMDAIALKIREVADATSGIPIVENPPLACALHGTVEIDREIPAEHYQAVAEVIGYVTRLNRAVGAR